MNHEPYVVVGASLAGATTALTLRELGYDGDLVLIGDEIELPYERPALSKEYLLATMTFEQMLVRPRETYDDLGIELRLGTTAVALDEDNRRVRLADRSELAFSSLVITTGASNLRPPIPGLDLPGVQQLRTLSDAAALRAAARPGTRAAVVGMGFIGAEIAATLRQLDVEVTAIDGLAGPLLPQLGPQLSAIVRSWHEERDVRLLFDRAVVDITHAGSELMVRTSGDDALPADVVVVGVGVRPNVAWLSHTSLHDEAGVLVDANGRTTVAGVYAAGDVAALRDKRTGRARRTEHWHNAIEQGKRVAHTMLGLAPPPMPAPYFWSAQYGHYLQYVGEHTPAAHLVVREQDGRLTAFYVEADVVTAAVTIDNGKELRRARALLGQVVDVPALADPGVDLRLLAAPLPA